jgi:ceroid-lipofuscinosis neuronal protein 5
MHDALGFRSQKTGLNYTMEWYELDQLLNSTFPHLRESGDLTWCNQGALCSYDGIKDNIWTEYGTINKISEISGATFNEFAYWANYDNNTAAFYETWTVYSTAMKNSSQIMYFDSFDCASWTLRY